MGNAQSDFEAVGRALDPAQNGFNRTFDPAQNGFNQAMAPVGNAVIGFAGDIPIIGGFLRQIPGFPGTGGGAPQQGSPLPIAEDNTLLYAGLGAAALLLLLT